MKYFFVLGNTPALAREEVKAVLSCQELLYEPPVLILDTESEIPFERFGGVVKIGEVIESDITSYLKSSGLKSIDFGISNYGIDSGLRRNDKQIKRDLVEAGIKTRFVLPKKGEEVLSSVVVRKQLLTEFLLFNKIIAKTIWSQDFEDWGVRDFGRPAVDPHIGMLPPKVARMMINIAVRGQRSGVSIFDPFCGTGTILMEALSLALKAFGSDINPAQIAKTQKNLEWLGKTCELKVADAREVVVPLVDAIVTEPFLGPADPKALEQLYYDCLKHWLTILKPGGRVVIAFPFVLDMSKVMGYSLDAGPYIYSRPNAIIKRFIHILNFDL